LVIQRDKKMRPKNLKHEVGDLHPLLLELRPRLTAIWLA